MRSARSSSALERISDEKRDALEQVRPASASAALSEPSPPPYTLRVTPRVPAPTENYTNRSPSNASARNNQRRNLTATPEKESGFVQGVHAGPFEIKRPDSSSSDTIRRSINPLQFANIADKLDGAADRAHRNNGWHLDEPELELVQVMAYMRQRVITAAPVHRTPRAVLTVLTQPEHHCAWQAATSQILVVDFFRSFDLHRKGYICPEHVYQAASPPLPSPHRTQPSSCPPAPPRPLST
jgi:hypothetical protein